MSRRTQFGRSIHDWVIEIVAAAQARHDTYTNPGHEHNYWLHIGEEAIYPDLILCTQGTTTVTHLIEVETADSVNEAESSQWAQYARGPGSFWLLVPSSSLAAAQQICWRKGIAANFGQWWVNDDSIQFQWLPTSAV